MFSTVNHGAIQPEEVVLLQRVFDQVIAEAGVRQGSHLAELVGASLIEMFQNGLREEDGLLARAGERQGYSSGRTA